MTTNTTILRAVLFFALLSYASVEARGASLSEAHENAIRDATFEVVVRKPAADPLTYEKPLPLDLLPFSIRTDKYRPIGTAFAIGRNEYVSAGHVFYSTFKSFYGPPQLRDRQGRLFDIDRIIKYSYHEDFIVFSLRDPPPVKPLLIGDTPRINSTVFAAGNVLGEGVVLSSGVYTSSTPEELDGAWNWIRFSAAVAPGSSGGPLVDSAGRAIGAVIGVSFAESMNYAVPMARMTAASISTARIEGVDAFHLPVMKRTDSVRFKEEFSLPASYAEFSSTILDTLNSRYDRRLAEFQKANADVIFPHGEKSAKLLHTGRTSGNHPYIIVEGPSGDWEALEPFGGRILALKNDANVNTGTLADTTVLRLWIPTDVTVARLLEDSRVYMDLVLNGLDLTRSVNDEEIRITSLGNAATESKHVDSWGRHWQVRTWHIPHDDVELISFALPIPGGCAALIRIMPPMNRHVAMRELAVMTDFLYITYVSSLENWRDFLGLESWLPAMLPPDSVQFEYGKYIRYRSPLFEFDMLPGLFPLTEDTQLGLVPKFIERNGTVRSEVAVLNVMQRQDRFNFVSVSRRPYPKESLGKDWQREWQRLMERKEPPYDGSLRKANNYTQVATYFPEPSPDVRVFYEILYSVDVEKAESEMRKGLRSAAKGFKLLER